MDQIKNVFANRIKVARLFFIISALYGLFLRLYYVVDFIPISYKNILQAHSHVTFLGWGFLAVITITGFAYYPKSLINSSYIKWLFIIMSFTLAGMLISFPAQGYKLFSIVFLSVFLITSYLYLINMLRFLKPLKSLSAKYIITGIYYYFLSSLGIWAIAIITVKFGKIDLYFNSVYFYLHFLYNGFFVFVLFGLLVKYFETNKIAINKSIINTFYWLANIALIPAFALSLLWNAVPTYVYIIGIFAVILQLTSLYYLYIIIKSLLKFISTKHIKNIIYFVFISYFIKIVMQFFSAFLEIVEIALQYKPFFVVGYLHLFTLGFMSMFIILLLKLHLKLELSKLGVNLLMIGIFLSEILLFLQGGMIFYFGLGIPKFNLIIFTVSILMPLGLIIIHINIPKSNKTFKNQFRRFY